MLIGESFSRTRRGGNLKFCYADESGHGAEVIVMTGVIVDSARMHRTKSGWNDLIETCNKLVRNSPNSNGRQISELKGRDIYRGNAAWRTLDGGERTKLIELVIRWMCERKHKVTFGAVSRARLLAIRSSIDLEGFQDASEWCIASMQLILGLQRQHQKLKKNKGNTVYVFDNAQEKDELLRYVQDVPFPLNAYYDHQRGTPMLDQVIDVPFFVDSKHVELIQVADLFSYIFRLYSELKEGLTEEKFEGEQERLRDWIDLLNPVLLPNSSRWKKSPQDPCASFFRSVAPPSLLTL